MEIIYGTICEEWVGGDVVGCPSWNCLAAAKPDVIRTCQRKARRETATIVKDLAAVLVDDVVANVYPNGAGGEIERSGQSERADVRAAIDQSIVVDLNCSSSGCSVIRVLSDSNTGVTCFAVQWVRSQSYVVNEVVVNLYLSLRRIDSCKVHSVARVIMNQIVMDRDVVLVISAGQIVRR